MEAGDRIERRVSSLRAQQIVRAELHDFVAHGIRNGCEGGRAVERECRQGRRHQVAVEHHPRPKTRHWRQRGELANLAELAAQVLDDLLDQEVAERDSTKAYLTIGDR